MFTDEGGKQSEPTEPSPSSEWKTTNTAFTDDDVLADNTNNTINAVRGTLMHAFEEARAAGQLSQANAVAHVVKWVDILDAVSTLGGQLS